jgi:HAMP domain-containing protein
MAVDLVRPAASLHEGVTKLRSIEYDHRIAVARRDELGELAEAFNGRAAPCMEMSSRNGPTVMV